MKPPCAEWSVWKGAEVEGTKGVGESTLFIRSLESFKGDLSILGEKSGCTRVWFCKEFYRSDCFDWDVVRTIRKYFTEVCIEAEIKDVQCIPKDLRKTARIYLKVDSELKPGDFVCVGPAFSDEAFEIGTGAKVKPELYLKDTRIK